MYKIFTFKEAAILAHIGRNRTAPMKKTDYDRLLTGLSEEAKDIAKDIHKKSLVHAKMAAKSVKPKAQKLNQITVLKLALWYACQYAGNTMIRGSRDSDVWLDKAREELTKKRTSKEAAQYKEFLSYL